MQASKSSQSRTKWQWIIVLALVLVTAGLVAQIRREGRTFEWALFASTFTGLDWRWLLLASIFGYATYYGRALRWAVLLKPLRPHPNIWNLFKATVIGFSALALFGRPGEFVRPYLIAVKEDVPLSSQLAAWLLERFYDLLIALLLFGVGLSQVQESAARAGPALRTVLRTGGNVVWTASVICVLALLLFHRYSDAIRRRLLSASSFLRKHHLEKTEHTIDAFFQGLESNRSARSVLMLIGYTLLEWFLICVCYLCIMHAFGNVFRFSPIDILIFTGFVAFGGVIQLPGVGGGMQVVAVIVLNQLFEVPVEVATSMALVIWSITFIILLPVGIPMMLHEGLNYKRIRSLREDTSL